MLSSKQTLILSLSMSTLGMVGYYLHTRYAGLSNLLGAGGTSGTQKEDSENKECNCKECKINSFYPYKCLIATGALIGGMITCFYTNKK